MTKLNFKGKKVLIFGLGLLGRGINDARFFAEEGAKVTVTDLKSRKELSSSLKELADLPINFVLGKHQEKDFKDQDLIIRGAGVPRDSKYLKIARENKIPIEMDESLFAKNCPCPIIGITGTRGKTTVTTLIYNILKNSGKKVFLGGNIKGLATLPLIKKVNHDSLAVLELSSWQLQGFGEAKISPKYSVITNIFPDHLDKYKDMEEYINDKKNIYKHQKSDDYLFLNSEDSMVSKFYRETKSKVVWFSRRDVTNDFQINLPGQHNLSNISAALKVAEVLGVDSQTIYNTIAEFNGVAGRLELTRKINGVRFINDTTSTTPIACEVALDAFQGENIILIVGGADKKLDFIQLAKKIVSQVNKVIFLEGAGTIKLQKALKELNFKNELDGGTYNDLAKAVNEAYNLADSSSLVILFSPACSSFGLFVNEYDRGEKFNQAVKDIKKEDKQ